MAVASDGGPRLCQIYLRDALQFLPRTDIERLRIVSKHANTTILSTQAGKMPRLTYPSLEASTVGGLHSLPPSVHPLLTLDYRCRCADSTKTGTSSSLWTRERCSGRTSTPSRFAATRVS